MYGRSNVAWKTRWIFQVSGSFNRYVRGPKTSSIWNGFSHLGDIFLWYSVFRFLKSSHTCCPWTNGVNVDLFQLAIQDRASSCAAKASSLSASSRFIFSLIEGYFVCVNARGMEIGVSLIISSNGVCVRTACLWLLCVNSRVVRDFSHSLGWDEQ